MSRETTLPIGWKPYSDFSRLTNNPQSSGHLTEIVAKLKKEKQRKPYRWVFKKFDNPLLAQAEAATASLYRLVLPNHIPKVRVVYDRHQKPIGTVSKFFEDAISLKDYLGNNFGAEGHERETQEKVNVLVAGGFAEILALSWLYEEDDGHTNNIALIKDKNGKMRVVKYDFDMGPMSIVGMAEYRGDRRFQLFQKKVEERFAFTQKDFNAFPELVDCMPYYWPTRYDLSAATLTDHAYTSNYVNAFKTFLINHPEFSLRADCALLQATLHADEKEVFKATISDRRLTEFFHKMIVKKNKLKEMFFKSEQFNARWTSMLFRNGALVRENMRDFVINRHQEKSKIKIDSSERLENQYYMFCRRWLTNKWYHSINLIKNFLTKNESGQVNRLHDELFESCKAFYALELVSFSDVYSFIEKISTIKNRAKGIYTDSAEWTACIEQLVDNLQLLIFSCGLIKNTNEAGKSFLSFLEVNVERQFFDEFESVPQFQLAEGLPVIKSWLFDVSSSDVLKNKTRIQEIFSDALAQYVRSFSPASVYQRTDSGFLSSSWVTFFRVSQPVVSPIQDKLTLLKKMFSEISTKESLEEAIKEFLLVQDESFNVAHKYFFSCVFQEVSKSFFKSLVFDENTIFAEYMLSLREVTNIDSDEIAEKISRNFLEIRDASFSAPRENHNDSRLCFDSEDDFVCV